ncbi:hypothetical protein bplSymb_SCF08401P003 [Bathymodiolus platifrons methanotrophic gill symbiont]|uniref:hypothetical protein n=1 Tax=Bathymodiolus platifrons methanotrophic gill symbiont TaxID=113268 RepID=UPI000B414A61|nr:hypothetical protein [Bathymodiolus platifrons methanotrophic gill symbiont]GAW87418.1 hypothetical protein bplSymb_SCF08401P003 [Bathymodiolus platifrons methanotrophic gill symbiont]
MNKQALIFLIMLVTSSNVMALKGSKTEVSSDKTLPSLAVVEGYSCTVTMIGNFVGLTKATCGASKEEDLSDTPITVVSAKTGTKKTAHFIPHPKFDAKKLNPKYDIAVVILDSGFDTNLSDLVNLFTPIKEEQILKESYFNRFVLYSAGIDMQSDECNTQGSNQGSSTRSEWFVTKEGCWVGPLFYWSFADINFESPSRLYQGGKNQVLPDWQIKNLFIDNGMTIEDLDESFFVLAPSEIIIKWKKGDVESPVSVQDYGATAMFEITLTELGFVGFVHSENLISRVLPHWSWILDVITKASVDYKIISHVNSDKNHILSQIIPNNINSEKGNRDSHFEIGQIEFRSLPDKGTTQYFRLIGSFADLPTTAKDTKNWEYLGTKLPKAVLNPTKLYKLDKLGDSPSDSDKGLCFVYYNPTTKKVEYYIALGNNAGWEYIGTENPDMPRTVYPKSHNNMTANYLAPRFVRFSNLTLKVENGRWARYIELPLNYVAEGREVRVARYSTWWTEVRTGGDPVRLQKGKEVTFIFEGGVWKLKD